MVTTERAQTGQSQLSRACENKNGLQNHTGFSEMLLGGKKRAIAKKKKSFQHSGQSTWILLFVKTFDAHIFHS